jgi:hypothetical protein
MTKMTNMTNMTNMTVSETPNTSPKKKKHKGNRQSKQRDARPKDPIYKPTVEPFPNDNNQPKPTHSTPAVKPQACAPFTDLTTSTLLDPSFNVDIWDESGIEIVNVHKPVGGVTTLPARHTNPFLPLSGSGRREQIPKEQIELTHFRQFDRVVFPPTSHTVPKAKITPQPHITQATTSFMSFDESTEKNTPYHTPYPTAGKDAKRSRDSNCDASNDLPITLPNLDLTPQTPHTPQTRPSTCRHSTPHPTMAPPKTPNVNQPDINNPSPPFDLSVSGVNASRNLSTDGLLSDTKKTLKRKPKQKTLPRKARVVKRYSK